MASAVVGVSGEAGPGPGLTEAEAARRLEAGFEKQRAEIHHTLMVLGLSLAGLVIGTAGVSLAAAALLFN